MCANLNGWPVQRRPAAQTSVESGLLEDAARGSPHAVNSELDGGHSSEREARLQTLVANMSRQLHTLGYDWNDHRLQWVTKTLVDPVVIRVALTQARRIPCPVVAISLGLNLLISRQ